MIVKEPYTWEQQNVNRNEQPFVPMSPSAIHNAFKNAIAATDKQFIAPTIIFSAFKYGGPLTWFKPTEKLLRRVGKLGDTYNTKGICIPVDVEIPLEDDMVTPPVELVKDAIRKSSYRVIMNECACRKIDNCKDYPHDIACMFLGEGAKSIVEHKSGREATVEECIAHVDRAIETGLMIGTYWVEIEQYCWGIRDEDMPDFIAFCFCCPCCCIAMRLARNATDQERHRFHPSGWTAVPDTTKCVGCKACMNGHNGCPVEALSIGEDGKIRIDQDKCVGCGICRSRCPHDAIHIRQTMPMRNDIQEYFLKDYNLDLKLGAADRTEN